MHLCAGGRPLCQRATPTIADAPALLVRPPPRGVAPCSIVCHAAGPRSDAEAASPAAPKKSDLLKVPGVGKRNQELLIQQQVVNVQALTQAFEKVIGVFWSVYDVWNAPTLVHGRLAP